MLRAVLLLLALVTCSASPGVNAPATHATLTYDLDHARTGDRRVRLDSPEAQEILDYAGRLNETLASAGHCERMRCPDWCRCKCVSPSCQREYACECYSPHHQLSAVQLVRGAESWTLTLERA